MHNKYLCNVSLSLSKYKSISQPLALANHYNMSISSRCAELFLGHYSEVTKNILSMIFLSYSSASYSVAEYLTCKSRFEDKIKLNRIEMQ